MFKYLNIWTTEITKQIIMHLLILGWRNELFKKIFLKMIYQPNSNEIITMINYLNL